MQCNVANYCYKNIPIINMVILVNNTAFVFLVINSFLPDLANQPTPQKYNVKYKKKQISIYYLQVL